MKNNNLALLVMAAGMGSRYGGIKQIDGFGPNKETIMDYSLYDAIRCGYTKIVFVVRQEILSAVQDMFLPKLEGKISTHFAIQSLDKYVPKGFEKLHRNKPWGTTHAMLCCKEMINEPFAVINADDFYGRDAFASIADFFKNSPSDQHAMVGYVLKNVLSEHGSVSRGVAEEVDEHGFLKTLSEIKTIVVENGDIISKTEGGSRRLRPDLSVSMNCWGFQPGIFPLIQEMFNNFVLDNANKPTEEFYIAQLANEIVRRNMGKVKILSGGTTWFGVTYKEDKDEVSKKIMNLVKKGDYPSNLWG